MAILSERTRRASIFFAVIAGLSLLGACMIGDMFGGSRRFAFSHEQHVGLEKLACINCHADAKRADAPGMPSPDACNVCHDEIDAKKPVERRVAQLFDGASYRATHAMKLGAEIVFSHKTHAGGANDCAACHAAIATNAAVDTSLALTMSNCTSCHAAQSAKSECATCHREIRAEIAPATHANAWKKRHGGCARDQETTVDRCELCHREATCIACHRSEAPDNHTSEWLRRGHGATAMFDRQTCAACHEPDSCARCHRDTLPVSHVANFGAPRDNHCVVCHFPLSAEGCATCHTNTPSHRLATHKPADPFHVTGANCRQCHGVSAPLPHVDNGDDCNACHH